MTLRRWGLAEFGYADATTGYGYHGNFTRYYTQAELQKRRRGADLCTKDRDGRASRRFFAPANAAASIRGAVRQRRAPTRTVYAFAASLGPSPRARAA